MDVDEAAAAVRAERRVLTVSLLAAAVLGVGAVVWGLVADAGALIFDGVYTLAGIALSAASLLASRAAASAPSRRFPFGKQAAVPIAVVIQGAALGGTLLYAVITAVQTIIAGGSAASQTALLAYGVLAGVYSVLVALILRSPARDSDLARAEVVSWRAGTVLSLVIAVGGAAGLLLERTALGGLSVFMDPVLVLIAVAITAAMPLQLIRSGMHELLEGAPPPEILARIEAAVEEARAAFGLPVPLIRSTKLGRRLYVEVDFVVAHDRWDVDAEDRVRHAIVDRLEELPFDLWAAVELTTDESLAT
ncbi:cation transporter [Gryllotalpicola koreensis]|uniref:Cation diffusion facilitator family transporter n=1 Tax=Gryllotalpicola koreensis TaxID=993086 RepID=A0ABP7ZY51_9MICO